MIKAERELYAFISSEYKEQLNLPSTSKNNCSPISKSSDEDCSWDIRTAASITDNLKEDSIDYSRNGCNKSYTTKLMNDTNLAHRLKHGGSNKIRYSN